MGSGKRRCAECKYDFIPHNLPLRLTRDEWKQIIRLFFMEQNSNSIIERNQFERCRVFRALKKIRIVVAKDLPEIFSGTVEVDGTYVGGQWKNKRKSIRDLGTKREGDQKTTVFGILCRTRKVWAEVVNDVDTWKLKPELEQRGHVHRLANYSEKQYCYGKGILSMVWSGSGVS
jgi:hypothetical protein